MEAATPLRQPRVTVIGDRLAIDGLVVDDECAVRLVREREQHGEDPVRTVRDAVEIGARVLDREQAAANAEFVKAEFEKTSREVQQEFADKARTIAEFFETAVRGRVRRGRRPARQGARAPLRRRQRDVGAEPRARRGRRDAREVARGPGAPVLGGRRSQPARRLQDGRGALDRRRRQALGRDPARAAPEARRPAEGAPGAARREGRSSSRSRPSARRARPRGAASRSRCSRRSTGSRSPRATSPRPWATSRRRPARSATCSWPLDACNGPARGRLVIEAKDRRLSRPARARRARQRRWPSARPTSRCWWCPPRRAARQARAAARVQRRQAGRGARPRTRARSRSSSATGWRGRAC